MATCDAGRTKANAVTVFQKAANPKSLSNGAGIGGIKPKTERE
jgi:hypothetical protein